MSTKFGRFTIVSYQVEEFFFLDKLSYKFSKLFGRNNDREECLTIVYNYRKLISSSLPTEYHNNIFLIACCEALYYCQIAIQTNNESSPKWKDILIKLYYENKKIEGYSKERIESQFVELVAEKMNEIFQQWEEEKNSN